MHGGRVTERISPARLRVLFALFAVAYLALWAATGVPVWIASVLVAGAAPLLVAGGAHATVRPEETLAQGFDVAVVGDARLGRSEAHHQRYAERQSLQLTIALFPELVRIDLSNRDRNQYNVTLRTAYELQPLRQVYLVTGYNRRDYNRDINSGGVDRDSQGFTVGPGIRYDVDGVIFFDLFAGYRRQDFADPTLRTVNGVVGEGRLTWNVTKLTTVTALVSRDLRESTLLGASSYFATRAALTVDHELWRNLLLNGRVEYERDSYQGSIDRTDNYYVAGAGAKYLINRYLAASGGYGYRERSSDANNADFVDHTVTLRLGVHY